MFGTSLDVVAAIAGALLIRRETSPVRGHDCVLLGNIANLTDEPLLDDMTRRAVAAKLEESPFLTILSDEHIRDILRKLGRPLDARLTKPLANEV